MNKNDVTVNYAFQEYFSEKELNEREVKGVSKILTYEEPRWSLKDTASALKIIKEADSSLYEKIQSYIKEQHLPSENVLYLDFGKSLRYDREYMGDFSKETLSDKLDNRFIVRYSHDNDEGNLIDGGDEIIINDENIVSLFNSMIEEHVKENIQKYDEYKTQREASQKNEVWTWKDYDDLSGHLVAPDGKSYFSYDWTTKEYKVTPDSVWDSFLDADPTRDTSLTAFKEYAQKFVKENIVKDRDLKIIFEREYIDTEKLLEEEEKRMAKSETLADKYNRMEKIFEVKMSHLGSGNGETFNELCKWVEEEFPEKDSEAVLLEATSRMLEEMFDFDEFNYQNYDDVYGFGDGTQWRFDLSESAAKKLLSGEILNYYEAQNYIWEKTKKEFAELKNNPQYKDEIEITDRINSAFRIADFLYPEFTKEIDKEKNLLPDEWPQYSKEEKKNVINNAFERLDAAFKENRVFLDVDEYDEDRLIIVDKSIPLKHFETLIKGRDAVNFGKESLSFTRPNAEQLQTGIKNGWGLKEILTGYDVFQDRFNESGQMLAELEAEKEFVPSEYVLSKLKEKGIEVVTEKEEFDKILESQSILQKMTTSLSELNKLSKEEKNLKKDISKEQEVSQKLSEKEETINNHYFDSFVSEMQKYQDIFSKDVFIKICNLDYENLPSKNFELYLGKDWRDEHLVLSLNCETPGHKHDFHSLAFYDITENKKLIDEHSSHIGYGGFPYKRIANDCLNVTKKIISDNDYIPQIQNNLKEVLESQQIKEKAILEELIQKNNERKITVEKKLTHINLEEKRAAEKTLESWLELADDMEDSLWNKDQLQVKKLFLENGTEERKPIAIITESGMSIFEGIKDHNLYADKSYIADHYINRHHNARTFLNIQNVLNNYDNIYFDKDQNSIGFAKKYGKMVDCVFMRAENGKIVLFGTTFEQPEYKLENGIKKGRYVIITPVMLQKQNMSVEGSTPLSHNSIEDNGKAAVAISDVTDNLNIPHPAEKSSNRLEDGSMFITQMKTEEIKADISIRSPNDIVPHLKVFANSEVENFGIILLDGNHKVKEIRAISVGTVNRSIVHPREVFKEAIRKNAAAVLVFHNHPSGNTEPSNEDVQTTKSLMEASNIIGIPILDHIIISPYNYFSFVEHDLLVDKTQNMIHNGTTYGFAHNGKIYLNPEVLSAEVAMHEYTHLWDNLTRKDNPELWNKGLQIFKGTSLWNEVVNDENYQDIKDDENLVLSECHARITGKVAEAVLNRIAEQDGTEKQAEMIDWDKETINFIFENYRDVFEKNGFETVAEFTSATMKELFSPVEQQKRDINKDGLIQTNKGDKIMETKILTWDEEKQFKMQQERNSDFAHPNAEDLDYASPKDIKEYCKLNSEIELTDEQVREIHNFYDNNVQFALYVSPAGNLYERDEYKEELISADSELLKAGNHLRTLEGKERLDYLLKNTSVDEPEWSTGLLNQLSNTSDERFRIVSDVLSDSFATLDRHDNFWKVLLEYGADPTKAIRIAAEDANLGDNLNWLLDNVPESQLNQIFSDNGYADAVFDIAQKSVEHDMDSWHGGQDIGFEGFKRIARLCEREVDADRYYGELLEKAFEYPVEPKIVQLLDTPELLAKKMNEQHIHQNEPEITKEQASAILDYCNYENIKFYCDKSGDIFSLDVSENYNGEGLKEDNFGIAANGIEYARKAKELNYSCYSTATFNMVSELWQKERQFVNPSVENISNAKEKVLNKPTLSFIDDEEKMRDFATISKEEFLSSYSYLSEKEYEATAKEYNELNQSAVQSNVSNTVKTVEDVNKVYDRNLDFIEQNISFKESNPEYNEIDEIQKWKNGELFIPVADGNGNFTNDMEANTLDDYNIYSDKNFGSYSEIIKYQADLKAELLDTAIENNIKEYLRREYAETYPYSGKFEVTVENQSYPIDKDGLDYIANSDEWGSVEDRLNDVIDRRFEEEIEQKENDILSDVKEYIAQETNGNLILKDSELREVLFSEELVQIYAPKEDFLANQPEEVKAALVEAGIARSELYNNVESIPVSEEARNAMLSASYVGQGGITQKAFADNGIEIDLATANALENCFLQIEAMTKYTADGHDLFHSGNGVDTISEHTIEYSEANKAWFVHEKNWLALSAIKGNEAEPDDYMEKAGRVGDRNWALSCKELVKYVYQEIKVDGEMEKEFPDTFKKLEKLNAYLEAPERIKENGFQRRKEDYFANIKVSTENFRDVFNEVIKLPKFKDKPLEAASWCFSKVPKENKAEVAQWFSNLGCKTKKDTNKLFNKWNRENNPKLNVNKSKNNDKDDWSISD